MARPAASRRACSPRPTCVSSSGQRWLSSSSCGVPAWPGLPRPPPLQPEAWTASSSSRSNRLPQRERHSDQRRSLREGGETGLTLTVFGLGLEGAVLGALVGDEDGAEEVGAALQLHAHLAAEVRDLVRQTHDPDGGAVGFPFVPGEEEERNDEDEKKRRKIEVKTPCHQVN